MGWMFCGKDREDREIGYGVEATCDHEGCNAEIDRGLAYACGGSHGEDWFYCEKYFCENHTKSIEIGDRCYSVCFECYKGLSDQLDEDDVIRLDQKENDNE